MDKIICVGKNYLAHAQELGDAVPEKPVLFLKPPSVLIQALEWNSSLCATFPSDAAVQPECELVMRVGQDAYQLNETQAQQIISHVSVGLDMTLRAKQTALKQQGHPWTLAKVFKDSAILGPWIPVDEMPEYEKIQFKLLINGSPKQIASADQMMMKPEALLVYISHYFPLKEGDIIYTGTPEGVTSIQSSDEFEIYLGHLHYNVKYLNH